VRAWEAEILAFHATNGCSNGPTEAMNLLIKKVKRVGHGFRNFANYRLRLLLHCGVRWQTHRTARLRGRSPTLGGVEPVNFDNCGYACLLHCGVTQKIARRARLRGATHVWRRIAGNHPSGEGTYIPLSVGITAALVVYRNKV
jgi:Transposase